MVSDDVCSRAWDETIMIYSVWEYGITASIVGFGILACHLHRTLILSVHGTFSLSIAGIE